MRRDLQGGIWAGRNRSIAAYRNILKGTAALLALAGAWPEQSRASIFNVGGGTITTTDTDNFVDNTGTGGSFELQANSTTIGDVVTISGVTINNSSGSPIGSAIAIGSISPSPVDSFGTYTVHMNGSNLTGLNGSLFSALSVQTVDGTVTLDTTGGAPNTISGEAGYFVANYGVGAGGAVVNTGADVITVGGAALDVQGWYGTPVSIDTMGATLTATSGIAIFASGFDNNFSGVNGSPITIGGSNGGIASSVIAPSGYGILADTTKGAPINITLAATGSITAKGGILAFSPGGEVTVESYGTITASGDPAITVGPISSLQVFLQQGSTTVGLVEGGGSFLTQINIFAGANIAGATFAGNSGSVDRIVLRGAGTGTFDVSSATDFFAVQKNDAGTWTLTRSAGAGASTARHFVNAGTLVGSTDTIAGSIASVAAGATLQFDQAGAGSYGGVISGAGTLEKTNSGTLTLTAANTYTGGTIVNAGTLLAGVANAFGSNSAVTVATGATLDLNGFNQAIGSLTGAGNVTLGNATLIAGGGNGSAVFSGAIAGNGALTKSGTGTLTLSGNNTYSGGTTLNAGTISLGSDTALGTGSLTTLGSVVDYANGVTISNPIIVNSNTTQLQVLTGIATQSGVISEAGGARPVEKIGAGTLTLTSANTYTGGTTISAGTLQLGNGGTTGSITGNVTNNGTLAFNRSDAIAFYGTISGSGGVAQNGTGTLTLTSANTYTGATDVNSGILQAGVANAFGSNSAVNVAIGATLDFNGFNQAIGSLAGGGNLTLGNATLTAGGGSSSVVFSGVISGSAALIKSGTGTLTLTGNNTYSGGTILNAGTISLGSNTALGTGSLTTNGSVIDYVNGVTINNPIIVNSNTMQLQVLTGTATQSGAISETGGARPIEKIGAGTLILTAANTYNGGTTISAGTLQIGNGGATGSIAGNVANYGTLAVDRTGTLNLSGNISGTGAVTITGGVALTLSGNNTYSGGTTLNAGTISLGSSSALGTGTLTTNGSVVDYASGVTINNPIVVNSNTTQLQVSAGTATQSGVISQSGGPRPIEKIGAGTLAVTAANTYTGGTTISGGTLQIGIGGTAGSIIGDVTNDATLAFNRSNAYLFAGVISGTGAVAQNGTGVTTLSAVSAYTGATTVNAGTLSVDGSIAASSGVTVNAGGTISGTGAVASTTINGGTLAPGNSVGTITVNGNLTFTGNSTYAVEVAPNAADLTTVTGVATLAGTLQATALGGTYMPGTQFTLIDAVGGVSGTFGMLSVAGNFTTAVRPRLAYDATRVYLVLDPNMISPFLSGATANETAAARALDQVFAGGNAPSSFLNLFGLSAGALNAAMASFSGEIHGSVRTAALDESRFVREAVMKRLNAAVASETVTQDGNAIWGVAFGSWGHTASDGNAGRFDRNIGGFLAGIDRTVASAWRLGLAAGYSYSSGTAGGLAGSKSDSAAHLAAYAGNTMGPWRVRLGAANAWNNFSTDRIAAFTGFSDRLKADYSGLTTQVFGEAGFRIDMDQIPVEPFTGLTYVNLQTGSFREAGGAAALNGIAATHDVTFSTLGFRSGNIIGMMDGMISVHGTAAWLHAFEAGAPRSTLALAMSGASFFASGVPIAQDSALIEIGAGASLAQGVNLSLDYTGRLASAFADHGVKGYASWRF